MVREVDWRFGSEFRRNKAEMFDPSAEQAGGSVGVGDALRMLYVVLRQKINVEARNGKQTPASALGYGVGAHSLRQGNPFVIRVIDI